MANKQKRTLLEEKIKRELFSLLESLNKKAAAKSKKAVHSSAKSIAKKFFKTIEKLNTHKAKPAKKQTPAKISKTSRAKNGRFIRKKK